MFTQGTRLHTTYLSVKLLQVLLWWSFLLHPQAQMSWIIPELPYKVPFAPSEDGIYKSTTELKEEQARRVRYLAARGRTDRRRKWRQFQLSSWEGLQWTIQTLTPSGNYSRHLWSCWGRIRGSVCGQRTEPVELANPGAKPIIIKQKTVCL